MSVSCNEVQNGKPDPEGYNSILEKLSISASDAIAVEDSPAGIEAALSAGIDVIGFDNKLQQDIAKATYYCDDMKKITSLIE
jgi:beta-phosphoglucomutase-like phosphatase (HAD superfamily)